MTLLFIFDLYDEHFTRLIETIGPDNSKFAIKVHTANVERVLSLAISKYDEI